MLSFVEYIIEAVKKSKGDKPLKVTEEGKTSANTRGVMHELLTGYHLNGGKHMEKHKDVEGKSPEEAHNKLKASMHANDYSKLNAKAKSAAEDIKKGIHAQGRTVGSVHWTSKPGDLHRSTAIHAAQHEDASDVVVTSHHKDGSKKFHGISLKSGKTRKVPTSNYGIEGSGTRAKSIVQAHKAAINKEHPNLASAGPEERRAIMKDDPKVAAAVKPKTVETIHKIAKGLHKDLEGATREQKVKHIRNLLHAHATPMEAHGHEHIRHTTYESAAGTQHEAINPGKHWEHILSDPKKHIEVKHKGGSISFHHTDAKTGKTATIASQAIKQSSQSDPHSPFVSSGKPG